LSRIASGEDRTAETPGWDSDPSKRSEETQADKPRARYKKSIMGFKWTELFQCIRPVHTQLRDNNKIEVGARNRGTRHLYLDYVLPVRTALFQEHEVMHGQLLAGIPRGVQVIRSVLFSGRASGESRGSSNKAHQ